MDKHFVETLAAAKELKESFKCLNCKTIPFEPYFTGVCDHLLCKDCISKSNECQICNAAFYQKDLHMNKMIKEAILYVNQIIEMTSPGYQEPIESTFSLPSLDLNINNQILKPRNSNTITNQQEEAPIFVMPQPMEDLPTQSKSRSRKNTTKTNANSQKPARSQSARARKSTQNEPELLEESQKPRTQSANRRVRKNDKGETPLHIAIMNNDMEKINELLNDPLTDINARDFAGWTPLHEAVNKDSIDIVKLLIEHNANINAPGYQNNTPLHEAALNKRLESVKYLLENGADENIRNDYGVLAKDFLIDCPEFLKLFDKKIEPKKIQSPISSDDFISSSFMLRKNSKNKTKKIVLYGSGMKDDEKAKMASLALKFNFQIAKEMNNNVTHVIFTSDKTCARTINYMKAILMGLEESFEREKILPENEYEAKGSVKMPTSNGPFKGRLNASSQSPKLFEDCFFYFYGDFNVFDKKDLIKLAEQAGAKILKREPKLERVDELITKEMPHHLDLEFDKHFSCSHFLIYDATKIREEIKHPFLYSVKTNWLFACIDQFKILHPESIK